MFLSRVMRSSSVRTAMQQNYDYFLVLDFEATCERNAKVIPYQEIIEFPVAKLNAQSLVVESYFHKYVRPEARPILTPFCTELTGIIQEMVEKEKCLSYILHSFDDWMKEELREKTFIFVTCGDWDLKTMLPSEAAAKNIFLPSYFSDWINIKKSFCDYSGKFPRGIKEMLEQLQIRHEGRLHSGIDDVRNICAIVSELVRRGHVLSPDSTRSSQESRRFNASFWRSHGEGSTNEV